MYRKRVWGLCAWGCVVKEAWGFVEKECKGVSGMGFGDYVFVRSIGHG